MSKATYWQRGESLDFKNITDEVIEANTILAVGDLVGIAGTDITPGETGSLIVSSVFEMPKTGTVDIAMGTKVYFDGDGITGEVKDTHTPAGYAAQMAAAADSVIYVKLLG